MLNTLFLISGLFPLAIGTGFIFQPRRMRDYQTRFRKRLERLEKKTHRASRATGLSFLLTGTLMVAVYSNPNWIYRAFLAARIIAGVFFPHMFEPVRQASVTPTVFI